MNSRRSVSVSSSSSSSDAEDSISDASAVPSYDEASSSTSLVAAPPGYTSVLLETHLAAATNHPGLYSPDLIAAIKSLLLYPLSPPDHPYRTCHTLAERVFPDGAGTYVGELDPKLRRHGYGHQVYAGGDVYQGTWRKGRRCGAGSYLWAETGSVYHGEWRAGERAGRGAFVFGPRAERLAGAVYVGVWQRGQSNSGRISFVNERGRLETVSDGEVEERPQEREAIQGMKAIFLKRIGLAK